MLITEKNVNKGMHWEYCLGGHLREIQNLSKHESCPVGA